MNTLHENLTLSGYKVLHQTKKNCKGGGLCVFVHEIFALNKEKDWA